VKSKEDVLDKVKELKGQNKFEQALEILDGFTKENISKVQNHYYKKGIELFKKEKFKKELPYLIKNYNLMKKILSPHMQRHFHYFT